MSGGFRSVCTGGADAGASRSYCKFWFRLRFLAISTLSQSRSLVVVTVKSLLLLCQAVFTESHTSVMVLIELFARLSLCRSSTKRC